MNHPIRRYRAFISYRHLDNRDENRRWAQWLHDRLEGYLVPRDLVRGLRQSDPDFPDSLYPVFRDEKELRPGGNLAALIGDALARSDALVVLCSPRSAQSPWVRREIIEFKKRGLAQRIIVVVIAGEPGAKAAWESDRRGDPNRECLPPALRYGVPASRGPDGRCAIDWRRPFEESLRIDLRAPDAGEGFTNAAAYRQSLERADQRLAADKRWTKQQLRVAEENYERSLNEAVLKIVAGILRVDLGELTRRDLAARSQRLRRAFWLTVAVLLAVSVFAVVAVNQSHRRQALLREASRADHARAVQLLRERKWPDALAYLARALHYWPENPAASGQLWLCLRYGDAASSPVPEPPLRLPGYAHTLSWSPTGNYLLATADEANVWLVNRQQRTASGPLIGKEPAVFVPPLEGETHLFSRDEKHLAVTSWNGRWLSFGCDPFQLLDSAGGSGDTAHPAWAVPILRRSDGAIHLLLSDPEHGTRLRTLDHSNSTITLSSESFPLPAADWHPSEPFLAVPTGAQTFAIFDAEAGSRLCADIPVAHPISSFHFHPSGDYLLCNYGDQTGEGWVVVKAHAPFSVLQRGASKGAAAWLPGSSDLLVAATLGLQRFSAPEFDRPERLYFDAINSSFTGIAADLPRMLLEQLTGRFEVFDLRLGSRLTANDALPVGLGSAVLDSTGSYVAAIWTPDYLDANRERNPHPTSHLGIWELPLSLPAVRGVVPDVPAGAERFSPDGGWSLNRPGDQVLQVRRLSEGDLGWTLELEERGIDAAQWQNDGRILAVRYRQQFAQYLPWPPPAESDAAITRFAVLLGGKELMADGSLAVLKLETQATWREDLRAAHPRHQRWKELRDWWLEGRPSAK